jgi:hypothetical protein
MALTQKTLERRQAVARQAKMEEARARVGKFCYPNGMEIEIIAKHVEWIDWAAEVLCAAGRLPKEK